MPVYVPKSITKKKEHELKRKNKGLASRYWKRRGFFYYSVLHLYASGGTRYTGSINRRLNFVAYNMIKWFHGEKKLEEMALNSIFR